MLVIIFTSYSIRRIADGFDIRQELKLTSLTICLILPFNALVGRVEEPYPILPLFLWLLFVIFFSVTFYVPLFKALKRKHSARKTPRRNRSRRRRRGRSRHWRSRSRRRYGDSVGTTNDDMSRSRSVSVEVRADSNGGAAAGTTSQSRPNGSGESQSSSSIDSSRSCSPSRRSDISLMDILTDVRYRKLRLDFEVQLSKEFAVENIMFFQEVLRDAAFVIIVDCLYLQIFVDCLFDCVICRFTLGLPHAINSANVAVCVSTSDQL